VLVVNRRLIDACEAGNAIEQQSDTWYVIAEQGGPRAGSPERHGLSLRQAIRRTIGLWPAHEMRNQAMLGWRVPAVRRFESSEVERMCRHRTELPAALVVTVIPTFRRPRHLATAVDSALAQTIDDHVVVVVDDGGKDVRLPRHDRLVVLELSRNCGIAGVVRNVGIRVSRSRYLAFLDDDNTWEEGHLAVALQALVEGADLVYTAVTRHRADGTLLDVLSTPFDRRLIADGVGCLDTSGLVVRRARGVVFSRIPRPPQVMPREDWEFVHRLARSRNVRHVPERTVRYLVNESSYFTDWT
jgi:glycosyl transferase family 2